jgi:hypothetical protein
VAEQELESELGVCGFVFGTAGGERGEVASEGLDSALDSQESALTGNTVEPRGTEDEPTPLWPVRETCADNPLLVGCPTADGTEDCTENPLPPGCPTAH